LEINKKMKSHLKKYIVSDNSTIKDVLEAIDENKERFSLVVQNEKLLGTLSDGDIRRLILSGSILNDKVEFSRDFVSIDTSDNFNTVCEKFRKFNIDFLPILKLGKLYNFLTKKQFHAMLLEGIQYTPDLNFFQFDSIKLEHEIYNRPWGFYKSTWLSSHAQAKIITIFPDSEISLQKHFKREEHWVIIKGKGIVDIDSKRIEVASGEYVCIPIECKHRITNTSLKKNLIISEVQLGSYFGEDDIVRYEDKYKRS
jgi:mannose-1-phosphate guanylyltransferase / mannose-6-phosphate isomerase